MCFGVTDLCSTSLSSWTSHFGQEMLSQDLAYANVSKTPGSAPITNLISNHGFQAVMMDDLVKYIYFTVLTDLGQDGPLNALASPTRVMKFANETFKLLLFSDSLDAVVIGDPAPPNASLWGFSQYPNPRLL